MTKKEATTKIANLIRMVALATPEIDHDDFWRLSKLLDNLSLDYVQLDLFWASYKDSAEVIVSKWIDIVGRTVGTEALQTALSQN